MRSLMTQSAHDGTLATSPPHPTGTRPHACGPQLFPALSSCTPASVNLSPKNHVSSPVFEKVPRKKGDEKSVGSSDLFRSRLLPFFPNRSFVPRLHRSAASVQPMPPTEQGGSYSSMNSHASSEDSAMSPELSTSPLAAIGDMDADMPTGPSDGGVQPAVNGHSGRADEPVDPLLAYRRTSSSELIVPEKSESVLTRFDTLQADSTCTRTRTTTASSRAWSRSSNPPRLPCRSSRRRPPRPVAIPSDHGTPCGRRSMVAPTTIAAPPPPLYMSRPHFAALFFQLGLSIRP